ncbi:MAG: ATP-binding protein [Gammaproteobacteria bacterium]
MNEVTLKVNLEALVRNRKFGFTSQVTVIGELMQNARRAKASAVAFDYEESSHRLTVTDDGIGIGDLQQLVTVAESGWDARHRAPRPNAAGARARYLGR